MTKNRDFSKYCDHFYSEQLRDSRVGALIVVSAFMLFLYADLMVYKYPSAVFHYRLTIIVFYAMTLGLSYLIREKRRLLRTLFDVGLVMALGFTTLLNTLLGIMRPELHERGAQVYIMITIGALLFAGLARRILTFALISNLMVFMTFEFINFGFSMDVFYTYFNIIFLTITASVFNQIYVQSKWNEFVAVDMMQGKIDELRLEIRKRQVLESKLKEMATYDALTNCYSRGGVGLQLLEEMISAADDECKPLTICYLDINNLKEVNDTYGHTMGDAYINEFVRMVRENCRQTDICIRLGGDEFLLVLPRTSISSAEVVCLKSTP